ncbi:hypothetical protein MRB53_032647 [Persea americana]|uniref:Uncharacterized protein n=1 Tax=Persea americana TaxID=3435 RepID=A0ACC2KSH5_PERAE|nr:hypothetical protein MRB53_032647 [Persea americana]
MDIDEGNVKCFEPWKNKGRIVADFIERDSRERCSEEDVITMLRSISQHQAPEIGNTRKRYEVGPDNGKSINPDAAPFATDTTP